MNQCEIIVKEHFKDRSIKKLNFNKPDFLIDGEFYVEVKNSDSKNKNSNYLSRNQIIEFSKLEKNIFIYYISKNKIVKIEFFRKIKIKLRKNKNINTIFEDKEMEKLEEVKGKQNWHNFIMSLVKVKK